MYKYASTGREKYSKYIKDAFHRISQPFGPWFVNDGVMGLMTSLYYITIRDNHAQRKLSISWTFQESPLLESYYAYNKTPIFSDFGL